MLLTDIFSASNKIVPPKQCKGVICPFCGAKATVYMFRSTHTIKFAGVSLPPYREHTFFFCTACKKALHPHKRSSPHF